MALGGNDREGCGDWEGPLASWSLTWAQRSTGAKFTAGISFNASHRLRAWGCCPLLFQRGCQEAPSDRRRPHATWKNLVLTGTSDSQSRVPSAASQRPPDSWGALMSGVVHRGALRSNSKDCGS